MTAGLRRWAPEPPGDNRPVLVRWPRWRLLLDDPQPRTVLVVGEDDPGVERWSTSIGAEARWVGGPRGLTRPADLVVVGADVAGALSDRRTLAWLSRSCADDGAVWLPGHRSRRRARALEAVGFARLFDLDGGASASRRPAGAGAGIVASRRGPAGRPPAWLAAVGAHVGWDATAPWSLVTPGRYPSQKAVATLRPARAGGPSAIVKLAQDPRFDDRVHNEAMALRALAATRPDFAAARTPAVLGEVEVGGTAGVVEEALRGRPFLRASALRAGCPLADDAAAAATELAGVGPVALPGAQLAQQLDDLRARFVAVAHPPEPVAALLDAQVAVIASRPTVPGVVVHGDLGTWNLVVLDGRVRMLDWESAASAGPPLWDLAYLARSYAVRCGRRRGIARAHAIGKHLVEGSSLTTTLARWFATYREAVGIDPELGEALFHTCWMHRAVKEAARVGPGVTGHYAPLCIQLLERRRAAGMRQLLGT